MTDTCLIALNKGLYTWVDVFDLQWLHHTLWYATPITFSRRQAHYAMGRADGRMIGMHRHILGTSRRELDVDHINHDGLDNRRRNLREVTRRENRMNESGGRDAPLSLGILPPGVPIIGRQALRACCDIRDLKRLLAEAPCSPLPTGAAA